MPVGMEACLSPGDFVLDGVSAPDPKKLAQPHLTQFSAHVYCGQTAGLMKTPLGTEVDHGPGHIVLAESQLLPAKRVQQPPLFSAHVYCGHGHPS